MESHTTMELTSSAFAPNTDIPTLYTCEGSDLSPPLAWTGVPPGTRSLALIVDDPDAPDPAAPKMTWVHWVLYNLPPDTPGLTADMVTERLPAGTREGLNDWQRTGYGGPCPPSAAIATSTNCMPSMSGCRFSGRRPRPRWKKRCKAISWRSANWWGITERPSGVRRPAAGGCGR